MVSSFHLFSVDSSITTIINNALILIYLSLSTAAIASRFVPFLQELARHGKTRQSPENNKGAGTAIALTKPSSSQSPSASFQQTVLPDVTVPKRFFLHFYVWGTLCTCICLLVRCNYNDDNPHHHHVSIFVLTLVHLLRRIYECCRVHVWRPDSRMHVAGYALGLMHYTLVSLTVYCSSHYHDHNQYNNNSIATTVSFVAGVMICLYGQVQQHRHHVLLANLRRQHNNDTNNNNNSYTVPSGAWFDWVVCPHYLAEIVVYLGFATVLGWTGPASTMVLWVGTNLTVSAWHTYDWYARNNYTQRYLGSRCAIVPFCW